MSFIEQTDETKALTAVEAAIDRGINFFDCANTYAPYDDRSLGPGRSERILAKAIKDRTSHRRPRAGKLRPDRGPDARIRAAAQLMLPFLRERPRTRLATGSPAPSGAAAGCRIPR